MKIESFRKQKNGMYKLIFEDQKDIIIHEDLIIKYNLLTHKEINEKFLEQLRKENQKYEAYNMALKYINIKLRSNKEIYIFLMRKGIDTPLINEVINLLIKQNYLNDEIYTTSFINDQITLTKNGPLKIRKELDFKGIPENIIKKKMLVFTNELIIERIKYLIDKKIKMNKNKGSYILKQKISNDLINMGYYKEDITSVLNDIKIEDSEDMIKKEYDKLYKKLSKKYKGIELDSQIKQRLYQKGFII